jgi:hypothetical protein
LGVGDTLRTLSGPGVVLAPKLIGAINDNIMVSQDIVMNCLTGIKLSLDEALIDEG